MSVEQNSSSEGEKEEGLKTNCSQKKEEVNETESSIPKDNCCLNRNNTLEALFKRMGINNPKKETFEFWKTQPVIQFDEKFENEFNGPIEEIKPHGEYRQIPYTLPDAFFWSDVDISDDNQLNELHDLLSENYVEDSDSMFRFNYTKETIRWFLSSKNSCNDLHVGIRVASSNVLVGFIGGVPSTISVRGKVINIVDIDFLCVVKKLRSKRMTPVLIKEISRRCRLKCIQQAMYTGGILIPTPFCTAKYWHRNINMKKLVDVSFAMLPKNMTLQRYNKLYRLNINDSFPGFREMTSKDVVKVCQLLNKFLEKYTVHKIFTEEDTEHIFVRSSGTIYSFVVENDGNITDFISFYSIPSRVLVNPNHEQLNVAYLYYYAFSKTPLHQLVNYVLVQAKVKEFDVFNALNIMDNGTFLQRLKFIEGSGELKYYLFNWKTSLVKPEHVAVTLI